jgi:peptidyl-prolyl cis-trans isomerase C
MKNLITIAAISIMLLLTACKQGSDSQQAADGSAVVATVNGEPITETMLQALEKQATQGRGGNIPRERLIEELISRELLYQEAKKNQLDQNPEIAASLNFMRLSTLSQAELQDFIKNHPVTDEEVKQEYDRKAEGPEATEYKARHILTKKEEDAKAVIEKLKKGEKFEALAKEYSTGPSKTKGGDLGWFGPNQMVPPFAAAVTELKKGEYTTTPVKTQFGWHVILLEDSRKKAAPVFDSVKQRIKASLQMQKVQKHIEDLRKNATIVMAEPEKSEEPKEAEKKPASSESSDSETTKPDSPPTTTQTEADRQTPAAENAKPKPAASTLAKQTDTKKVEGATE